MSNPAVMNQLDELQRANRNSVYNDVINPDENAPSTNVPRRKKPSLPTEFEQMVADAVGKKLPIYGSSLFDDVPTTFAPVSHIPVPSNYVIGPGDELDIRVWGPVTLTSRTTVDRNGEIYIPQVGTVNIAGVKYAQLEDRLKSEISRVFKNFQLSATLGRLRNVQVFVVGEASNPGLYTVSSLSTLVNAIFASGGPTAAGSLRNIQLKRGAQVVTNFDLYQLLVLGDKSKDVPIEAGDVIYFPATSNLIAVAGSVSAPAIYEIIKGETVAEAIQNAGGSTMVADNQKISIERSDSKDGRTVVEVSLDEAKTFPVLKGDIIRVLSLVPRFDQTVTLRGSVTNPGRYSWKPGMTLRDLIPSAAALLTREYWLRQAALTTGRATEYPVKPNPKTSSMPEDVNQLNQLNGTDIVANNSNNENVAGQNVPYGDQQQQLQLTPDQKHLREQILKGQRTPTSEDLITDIRNSAPEINWDYAIIQRVNPLDLTTKLIPFDLGKAIIEKSPDVNPVLESGDIVTIFSQRDISVPLDRRTRFMKIEGEVKAPGVYTILPDDNLRTILQRAGGISGSAYLYGAQFTRESVREQQQQSLDSYITQVSSQMSQVSAAVANGDPTRAGDVTVRNAVQQQMIASLRQLRAAGRIVLELPADANSIDALPAVELEDGDVFKVPARPAVVNVIGAVYNQGSFLYRPGGKLQRYFNLAGRGTPMADKKHLFIIRADGAVLTGQKHGGIWKGSFENYRMLPGDTLVVPSKLQIGMFQRNLRDWTQIISEIAITAASLAVVARQ